MAPRNLWHFTTEAGALRAGVTEPCTCKGRRFPTKRHGVGDEWRVDIPGQPKRSFEKKGDAVAWETQVRADLQKGIQPLDPTKGQELLEIHYAGWLATHRYAGTSSRTVAYRVNGHILPALGKKQLREITHSVVKAWLAEMRTKLDPKTDRPYAPHTVARVYDALATILQAAVDDEKISAHPCRNIPYPTPPDRPDLVVWEQERVDAVLAGIPEEDYGLALLAATCGHRQGEAFGVSTADIVFLKREIEISHQVQFVRGAGLTLVPPKGKRGRRTVPLPTVTAQALAARLASQPTLTVTCACHGKDYELLYHQGGRPLAHNRWNERVWHPALRAAGIDPDNDDEETGLHQFRHFIASLWIAGGRPIHEVSRFLGHGSIAITDKVYAHLFKAAKDKARAVVDAAFAPRPQRLKAVDE